MNKDNITKQQIIKEALYKYDIKMNMDEALRLFNAFIFTLTDNLIKGRTIELRRFGTFSIKKYKARRGYNFRTKQDLLVRDFNKIIFKPGKELKKVVK